MATPFVHTLRALAADRRRSAPLSSAVTLSLVALWAAWFLWAPVTVYEASASARIESEGVSHPVHAPVAARIAALYLTLGQQVEAGQVLVELDAEPLERRLLEEHTRLAALAPEIAALRRVLAARTQALDDDRRATLVALDEGRARQRQIEAAASLSQEELARAARLRQTGAIPELELLRLRSEAQVRGAESEAAALAVVRQGREQRTRNSRAGAELEGLERELVTLEGKQATTTASIEALRAELQLRTLRAPVAGSVEAVAALTPGAFVHEGDALGAIVPRAELRVVAEFTPATAVGRLRPGQAARVRLDSFPWAQYGALSARVRRVASEVRQGQVRAELALTPNASFLPLQHGMTASVEVEIEHATPLALVLRAAGHALRRETPVAAELSLAKVQP